MSKFSAARRDFAAITAPQRHRASSGIDVTVYLYGSALDGGLKPCSDIDLLVGLPHSSMRLCGRLCS